MIILKIYSVIFLILGIVSFFVSGVKDNTAKFTFISLILVLGYILMN